MTHVNGGASADWVLQAAGPQDGEFLRSMLFEALYVPDGEEQFPPSILDEPEIHHYVADFGEWPGDVGAIGLDGQRPVGACWLRTFASDDRGYGWVAADVPELSIALIAEVRGKGLGTVLIETVAQEAAAQGVERISLSVDHRSPAFRFYERLGFETVGSEGTSVTMARSV